MSAYEQEVRGPFLEGCVMFKGAWTGVWLYTCARAASVNSPILNTSMIARQTVTTEPHAIGPFPSTAILF